MTSLAGLASDPHLPPPAQVAPTVVPVCAACVALVLSLSGAVAHLALSCSLCVMQHAVLRFADAHAHVAAGNSAAAVCWPPLRVSALLQTLLAASVLLAADWCARVATTRLAHHTGQDHCCAQIPENTSRVWCAHVCVCACVKGREPEPGVSLAAGCLGKHRYTQKKTHTSCHEGARGLTRMLSSNASLSDVVSTLASDRNSFVTVDPCWKTLRDLPLARSHRTARKSRQAQQWDPTLSVMS